MMRSTLLVLVACVGSSTAAESPLSAARTRWLRGNFDEAREQLAALAEQPAAAFVLSHIAQDQGDYAAAEAAIARAIQPASALMLARRGELHYLQGRNDEAALDIEAALKLDSDQFLARWIRANLDRDRGELAKADFNFRWAVRTYTARNLAGKDVTDPDDLMVIARAGLENARAHSLTDQFRFILNELLADVLKAEKPHWPAESMAGFMLLDKYNRGEALAAFDKALAINPRAVDAIVGKGRAAFQAYDLKEAESFAERALAIQGKSIPALHLMADLHLMSGEPSTALTFIERAKAVNPRDELTLGREAAALFIARRQAEFDKLCQAVTARNPKPGRFYFALAERLDDRRMYRDAERYYRQALELTPDLPVARNQLGLLALRLGQEESARKTLQGAFEADPFNIRVANSIRVLRHLDSYESIRTPHFLLKFDPKTDTVLARFMAELLEEQYDVMSKRFDYRPAEPILIEVFNAHDMFSGRIVGLPDLHTIGASTGAMFAMVSPKGKGIRKGFNWARVVRHELVHVFNLEQTNFQVPHWLTEGLAVTNEGYPRPPDWSRLIAERTASDKLMTLETIDRAFIKPKSGDEWTQAYCQAQLYVEYLTREYGEGVIAKLLAAYRDGRDTAVVVQAATGTPLVTVEAGYKAYVRSIAARVIGRAPEKPLTLAQLQDAHAKKPDDGTIAARLAEQYLKRKRMREARDLAQATLDKHPNQGLAAFVLARVLLDTGDDEKALELLKTAAQLDPAEPKVLRTLGSALLESGQAELAVPQLERGRKVDPYDPYWLQELAKAYKLLDQPEKRIAALAELAPLDSDDIAPRRELAELLLKQNRPVEAERWAREVLEIDVFDARGREFLLAALKAQGKDDIAAKMRARFE